MVPRPGIPGRLAAYGLGIALFLSAFLFTVAVTFPGESVLSVFQPALKSRGVLLSAENARYTFPLGLRLRGVIVTVNGNPPVFLDEVSASWEWTGLFRWLPGHLRVRRAGALADIRLSPAVWNPTRGRLTVSGLSSSEIPLPVFSGSGAGFSVRRFAARWSGSGAKIAADGSGDFEFLQVPVPAPNSPIREARIDNVALSFVVRGNVLHVPKVQGVYEGSTVDGTGEIGGFLAPNRATVTFHLRVQNPFEGRIGTLFDMLSKNAKNATLRIIGSLASPRAEFQFF